jgi:hypothetical protein
MTRAKKEFEQFVSRILRVPKSEVDKLDRERKKRRSKKDQSKT